MGSDGVDAEHGRALLAAAVRDCASSLRRRALALTRSPADADDLVQRTLERGLQSLHQFQDGTNMLAWLLRIMTNRFLDDMRRERRAPRLQPLDPADATIATVPSTPEPEPAWASITSEQFQAALMSLPPVFRDAYELRIQRGMSYDAIAAHTGVPRNTVSTRLKRAREKLQAILMPRPGGAGGTS